MSDFIYNQLNDKASELEKSCRCVLGSAVPTADVDKSDDQRLRLAFVGQYNAGKSSLIKMLTGIDGIRIGAGVTTDVSTEYTYKGLHIVDTPGIRAGHCVSHDEAALRAITKADLLVFVITNELFDDVVAGEFRDLCFKSQRQNEILLVINKTQNDSGTQQTKLAGICPVLEPLIPENFPVVFTDAACYFEAQAEDDPEECKELLGLSNRDGLVEAIDRLVAERGLYARITTPLQDVQALLQTKLDELTPTSPLEGGAVSLMKQCKRLLQDSRRGFETAAKSLIEDAHGKIVRQGSLLADIVGAKADEFDRMQASTAIECKHAVEHAMDAMAEQLSTDIKDLEESVEALKESPMAKKVLEALDARNDSASAGPGQGPKSHSPKDGTTFNAKLGKSVADHAQKGLAFIAKSAVGNSAKEGLKGVSGSALHDVVKKVGELAGYKFQAWEAVKIADTIGKGAKFLGPVMAVAGVGMQIFADYQQSSAAAKLIETKRDIRRGFLDFAAESRNHLRTLLTEYMKSVYDAHIATIDEELGSIYQQTENQSEAQRTVTSHLDQITDFLQEVRQRSPWG